MRVTGIKNNSRSMIVRGDTKRKFLECSDKNNKRNSELCTMQKIHEDSKVIG